MIGIVDYGLGNLLAFSNVYKRVGIEHFIISKLDEIEKASKIILPGVGSFDYAMEQLEKSGLKPFLEQAVIQKKIPLLGICVGMQMLADSSSEGERPGLGWIPGKVKRFQHEQVPFLPHMGWNEVESKNHALLDGVQNHSRYYFLHSFYFDCLDSSHEIACTSYGKSFASGINKDNIYGVQFHPEKSHKNGVRLLENFAAL